MTLRLSLCALLLAGLTANAAPAQKAPAKPPAPAAAPQPEPEETEAPYDARLARFAELLGALSYLRPLCGMKGEDWRAEMKAVLDADTAREPSRRERMTAAFNRGYRTFAAMHAACSPAALAAEKRYRAEAATLVAEITGRFGN